MDLKRQFNALQHAVKATNSVIIMKIAQRVYQDFRALNAIQHAVRQALARIASHVVVVMHYNVII